MTFVPVANTLKAQRDNGVAPALTARYGKGTDSDATDAMIAAPLSHGSNPNSNMAAFHQTQEPIHGDDFSPAPGRTSGGMGVAFSENQRGELVENPIARQLTAGGGKPGQGYSAVREGASVRRLTPTECLRLQGLPDNWFDDVHPCPDSRMYAGLGDAVTAPVGEWIGRRIMGVAA